jgi:hypothetical protein
MMRVKIALLLVLSIIIAGTAFGGCGSNTELVKATATKHGISYSFEFPPSYTGYDPQIFEDTDKDPAVTILYREPESSLPKADKMIYVRPCNPVPDRPDASNWTEEHLKLLEVGDPRFELIERSTIQVAGIDGEYIKYYSSVIGTLLNATDTVCLDAYIDYQGYIWKLSVITAKEYEGEAGDDFQLLINSFEFLD